MKVPFEIDSSGVDKSKENLISVEKVVKDGVFTKEIEKYNDGLGKTTTITETLNKKTGEWTNTTKYKEVNSELSKMSESINAIGTVLVATGIVKIINEIKNAFIDATNAAIQFESAMIEVQKKTNFDSLGLQNIRQEILNLANEIQLAETEIAKIVATAGQLGIAEEYILSFTRVMANMGVATTLTSEQAAKDLARLANITQMSQTEFDRLGSAISNLDGRLQMTYQQLLELERQLKSLPGFKSGGYITHDQAAIAGSYNPISSILSNTYSNMHNIANNVNNSPVINLDMVFNGVTSEGLIQSIPTLVKSNVNDALDAFQHKKNMDSKERGVIRRFNGR